MLNVIFDGVSCTPNRSEAPVKTFASADVPSGTESVFITAAKVLKHSIGKSAVNYNSLSNDDIESKIVTRMSSIEVKQSNSRFEEEGITVRSDYVDAQSWDVDTMVALPTASEIQDKIDSERGFNQSNIDRKREEYWDLDEDGNIQKDENGVILFTKTEEEVMDMLRAKSMDSATMQSSIVADMDSATAQAAIEDQRKRDIATTQVNYAINNNLEVASDIEDISTGSATIVGTTLSDSSGTLVTDSVAAGDFVKCGSKFAKVVSITNETDMELDRTDMNGETDSTYIVIRSVFMSQFDFSNS
ncbi:MAG: hypothetical protein H8D97_00710 [Proteobacteria bacterium]|nr:hypothetical protein [Pseudomonadota bacterium]